MKRKKTHFGALLLFLVLVVSSTMSVSAAEIQDDVCYDLLKGGTQTFWVEGEDGCINVITVEEVNTNARISDGTYKVTYKNPGLWTAGFYVKISSNKITSAYSPFYSVVSGSISGANLTLNSSVKASYKFLYKTGLLYYNTGVIASISGTTLNVSKL